MSLGMEVGLCPGNFVLDVDPTPPKKEVEPGGRAPQFLAHVYCIWPNGWMHRDATWYRGRPQSRRLCVRWGPSPLGLPQKGQSPTQFSVHVYCGQTAAWIKMPTGTEIGLGLRNIVFDVDPATPRERAHRPHPILAHVDCGQMAGWMKTPLGAEVDLGTGHISPDGIVTWPGNF